MPEEIHGVVSDDLALDALSVFSIRLLAADMVDQASSGHLGTPFGAAPLANALWGKLMHFSAKKRWLNRDRFVLSCGHGSALLYTMLHLTGNGVGGPYEVTMEALKQFRKAGSSTPGHPEFRMTSGVEVTTGPLGQGFANAVGMAIAEAHLGARFNREGFPLFDNFTYVLAGDGCLMEGISSEAASLAGHLQLHKLICFYDDNGTTIDGKTDMAFSEDIGASFAAKGWNVLYIPNGDVYETAVFEQAVRDAKSQSKKPTIIVMTTTIGSGAGRGLEGTSEAHGGKYKNLEALREKWFSTAGLRGSGDAVEKRVADLVQAELDTVAKAGGKSGDVKPDVLPKFHVPAAVLQKFRDAGTRGDKMAEEWEAMLQRYFVAFRDVEPELVRDLQDRLEGKYASSKWVDASMEYLEKETELIQRNLKSVLNNEADEKATPKSAGGYPEPKDAAAPGAKPYKHKAGRVAVADMLKCFAAHNAAFIGGSADVASSCGAHFPEVQGHFLPPSFGERHPGASYKGRYIHFGVREHAMLAILNGISSSSLLIPYSALFTIFYQYGLPAIRMASISKFPVLYIGTHDSIDLGEDGPTHQPVEVLPQLRAMPNLLVIRPADVNEVVGAFQLFGEQYTEPRRIAQYVDPKTEKRRPVFIMTSRGELGLPYKRNTDLPGEEGVKHGAYVIHECYDPPNANEPCTPFHLAPLPHKDILPDIILIGSGQDVALVMKTKELLLKWSREFNQKLKGAFEGFPGGASPAAAPAPIKVRIVSMPCWELFDEQEQDYQDSVLLSNYSDIMRIYVEKAATKNTGHDKYAHFSVLMPSYGLSGPAADVERKLEFTPEYVAAKVWSSWMQRGRRVQSEGDGADLGLESWVSRLRARVGAH